MAAERYTKAKLFIGKLVQLHFVGFARSGLKNYFVVRHDGDGNDVSLFVIKGAVAGIDFWVGVVPGVAIEAGHVCPVAGAPAVETEGLLFRKTQVANSDGQPRSLFFDAEFDRLLAFQFALLDDSRFD